MEIVLVIFLVILGSYGLGSIPFGLVIARVMGLGDVTQSGSGNIGATNVLRVGTKSAALATLVLDMGKGAVAVMLTALATEDAGLNAGLNASFSAGLMGLAAAASVVGHCFPIWLRFKGGKGVATGIGAIAALHPLSGLAMMGIWCFVAATMRISSAASISAYALTPAILYVLAPEGDKLPYAAAASLIAFLSIIRHHANIRRLFAGTEPRIGK